MRISTPSRQVWPLLQGRCQLYHTHRVFRVAACRGIPCARVHIYSTSWRLYHDTPWGQRLWSKEAPITIDDTTTIRMSTRGDEKETTREPGRNPFPVSRVQKILKADTVKHLPGRTNCVANKIDSNCRWSRRMPCFSSQWLRRSLSSD